MTDGKEKKSRKKTVAGLVTRRVSLILIVAFVVLLSLAYIIVSTIILRNTEWSSEQLVTMYADVIKSESETAGAPITPEYPEISLTYGEYMCKWFSIDYAFVLLPNPEESEYTYVSLSCKDPENERDFPDHYIGHVSHAEYSQQEIDLWLGRRQFSHIVKNSFYGHELITETVIEDSFGNRISVGVDVDNDALYREINGYFLIIGLFLLLVIAGANIGMYIVIRRQVSEPVKTISSAMQNFVAGGGNVTLSLGKKECDEYRMIGDAFTKMSGNISDYLDNIKTLTRESEKQHTELDIAAHIQQGFLPRGRLIYERYELSAMMKPAKEVGGDLYDYLPLDENRVLAVIADVSGKGVAASIFMAVTLVQIREYAKMQLEPAEILRRTNDSLSANNPEMLFVTAFVGIYDSRTKVLTYSNAGHNLPYIVGDTVKTLGEASGTLLGLFEGEEYTSATAQLGMGDTLLLYTDGVTEATNADSAFYGEERLREVLGGFRASHAPDLVQYVNDSVRDFAGGSEQHDDITMLALTVKDTTDLELDVKLTEFEKIKSAILSVPLQREKQLELCLAAEECFVNIVSYAFEGRDAEREKITFRLSVSDRILMRFEDGGIPFDPRENSEAPLDYDPDLQIGGLGRFIAFSVVDEILYENTNGKNILTMIKYLGGKTNDNN